MASNRSTPQTISSSPTPQTVQSSSPQTISSSNPEYALPVQEIVEVSDVGEQDEVGTVEHISSSDDDDEVQILEARAETARARREEAEAKERLAEAHARRSRAGSSRASVQSISSARFSRNSANERVQNPPVPKAAAPVQPALPAQPALHAQPVRPVQSDLPAVPEPVLPEARHNWLEWFAHNAPQCTGQRV